MLMQSVEVQFTDSQRGIDLQCVAIVLTQHTGPGQRLAVDRPPKPGSIHQPGMLERCKAAYERSRVMRTRHTFKQLFDQPVRLTQISRCDPADRPLFGGQPALHVAGQIDNGCFKQGGVALLLALIVLIGLQQARDQTAAQNKWRLRAMEPWSAERLERSRVKIVHWLAG